MTAKLLAALSPLALLAASCSAPAAGDSVATSREVGPAFARTPIATFAEPWAMALLPGGEQALVTEKAGKLWLVSLEDGRKVPVAGVPGVDYGGQGGLGDVALAPDFAATGLIYLTWAEAGQGDQRGAALGWATLVAGPTAQLAGLEVLWRQSPKVSGRGHYSHRIAFSPDGKYLFLASGERQKFAPAQDLSTNLGKILRLNRDGSPAAGNPFAGRSDPGAEVWSYGHRNVLGLKFDAQGRLWDLEHGPQGGDELNLVKPGQNYGWPLVSDGDHYGGKPIPRNRTRPDLAQSAISWNPVIAPGDFVFYSGKMWPEWRDQALIAGLGCECLVRVRIDGEQAIEEARYPMGKRIREIVVAPDGALLVLEDGEDGRLLRLTRK
ncbi:MAG: PQQ-dependent sugar dehydrogenase [Novosphingobium sp.]|uniref:PQQ-dependent sugar dehydrogenase n=1 Tax=Novosphingobium sp. TaxID=1874826 RepID=UPI0032B7A757